MILASPISGQDKQSHECEPWLANQADNKSFIKACPVKMAEYMNLDFVSDQINMQKLNLANIQPSCRPNKLGQ